MGQLRIGTWLLMASLAAVGCDGGGGGGGGGGTDAGSTDGGGGVVDSGPRPDSGPPPDGGPVDSGSMMGRTCRPPMSECDLLQQDCAVGEACRHVSPEMGADPRGLCEPGDTCAEGSICRGGVCAQYCCDSNDADCPVGQFCLSGSDGVGFCRPGDACNVLDGSGCTDPSQGCYLFRSDRLCLPRGTIEEGGACEFLDSCVPGHACVGDPGTCRQLCDPMMMGADCPSTGTYRCGGLMGVTDVGVCVPM
jgi:hypothetical protein